jgi:hypothetical protein
MQRHVSTRTEGLDKITIRFPVQTALLYSTCKLTETSMHAYQAWRTIHQTGLATAAITKALSAVLTPSHNVLRSYKWCHLCTSVLAPNGSLRAECSNAKIPHKYLLLLFRSFEWKFLVIKWQWHQMKPYYGQRNAQVFNLFIHLLLPYMFRSSL